MARRNKRAGVTLLEVLIAIAIISFIAALTAPRLMDSFGRAKSQGAEIQLANLGSALQLYYLDVGSYPTASDGLGVLVSEPSGVDGWNGPYADNEDLLDPWGRSWIYVFPNEEGRFTLTSYGRDGQPGGSNEDSDISR